MNEGPREMPVNALTPLEASAELDVLAQEIAEHDRAYHQNDAPVIDTHARLR